MTKSLSGIIVDMEEHKPILKMNHPSDYQHFLKDVDRKNVKSLFYYCLDNDFDLYLTGSVATSGMMNGKRQYSDIDMLAVADRKAVQNLVMLLSRCSAGLIVSGIDYKNSDSNSLKRISKEKGIYVFDANGQLFQTNSASSMMERMYLNRMVDERFILVPLVPVSGITEVNSGIVRPSSIDLSVLDKRNFEGRCHDGGYI